MTEQEKINIKMNCIVEAVKIATGTPTPAVTLVDAGKEIVIIFPT